MDKTFDLIVIGFGKAGKTIAMNRAGAGDRVALIEQDPKMYGGTCINIGCVPTKKLLTDTARGVGWAAAVQARDTLIGTLNDTNLQLAEDAGVTVINGRARFTGSHQITVTAPGTEDLVLDAPMVVINTGSTPVWPDLPGIDGDRVFDSTSIQHIQPGLKHLAIVGGGPIGLEFATLFTGQGAKVTVIDSADTPLHTFDADIAEAGQQILEDRGVTFRNNARAAGFRDEDGGLSVRYTVGDTEETLVVDAALVAIGRRPLADDLGLEDVGIDVDDNGAVTVDEHLRTSVSGVFAVGDVNGGPQFTYVSYDDHRIVLDQLNGRGQRSTADRIIPTTTFTEPPLSTIGMGEAEAAESGRAFSVRSADMADMPIVPRPKILDQPEGMAKFLVDDETDEILGATLYCVDSQELINTVAVAMRHGITATELGQGIYTHPTSSEVFNQLLE